MTKWPEAFVLRHGQTLWNAQHRIQGGFDSPLTDLGREQARQQERILAQQNLAGFAAFSSPQGRAFATAAMAVVGKVHDIRTDDRLAEIRVGDYEGRVRQELPGGANVDFTEESALHLYDNAPGGEGFDGLHARCLSFLQEQTQPMVIVTHGITSRMLRLILMGQGLDALGQVGGGQGVVFHIRDGIQTVLEP